MLDSDTSGLSSMGLAALLLAVACSEPASPPEGRGITGERGDIQAAPAKAGHGTPLANGHLLPMEGQSVSEVLNARPSPVLLVNVWSTWCDSCVDEFPELVRVAVAHRDDGLGTVFISVDPKSEWTRAKAFLRDQGTPTPNYVKTGPDDRFIEALHPEWSGALPCTLLMDRQRHVRRFWEGPVTREMIEKPIEELLHAHES